MSLKKAWLFVFLIIAVDQISKIYIKTHFSLGESIEVTPWFKILFVENDGMAWGTKLNDFFSFISDGTAKLSLTLFRIVAVGFIAYWLASVIKANRSKVLITAIILIFSGALGNILDSVFYGVFFNDSYGQVASFLPEEGGYADIFYGKVVDMLHFPIWEGFLPEWLPFIGGQYFRFFEPVFNIADIAISTGIGLLIAFNKRAFQDSKIDTPDLDKHNNPA